MEGDEGATDHVSPVIHIQRPANANNSQPPLMGARKESTGVVIKAISQHLHKNNHQTTQKERKKERNRYPGAGCHSGCYQQSVKQQTPGYIDLSKPIHYHGPETVMHAELRCNLVWSQTLFCPDPDPEQVFSGFCSVLQEVTSFS